MTALTRAATVLIPLFALLLVPLAWVEAQGFLSGAVIDMWAKAIVQIEGPGVFRASDAFYPPLPFSLALILQMIAPEADVALPLLIGAAAAALLLYTWYLNLRERGAYDRGSAGLLVVLLALNPFFLRALAEGPSAVLLLLGFWIYARGLLNLRLNGAAPDMMKVAVGLLILPLSHAYGMLLALGTLPFIVLAARPSMLAASSFGYLMSMFFPVVAAIGSLLFVNAVLKTEFISAQVVQGGAGPEAWALLPTLCGLLVAGLALLRLMWRARLALPILAGAGSLLGGAWLNAQYGFEGDAAVVALPSLGLAVVAIRAWPPGRFRVPMVVLGLLASVPLALFSMQAAGGPGTRALLDIARGERVTGPHAADAELAEFLDNRSGILADVERNPGLVAALGDVEGFLVAGQPAYDITVLGGRPRGQYIAVRLPEAGEIPRDRLLRAYPQLEKGAPPPFRLRYDRGGWRVFEIVGQD
ncbi:hypothetical protein LR948_15035 [Roseivivax sp. GX 12232]|uniref:hypothetical protein n=1 Tax=Roseivivax sp. GX 12232 TaxID=2900547 RepID=UPI001E5893F6|nr:hypothetical protein [Roseivivax sp. GX 12232]MCE0506683.1 hypothetical protein [Roseivivax sp. GX 12232]